MQSFQLPAMAAFLVLLFVLPSSVNAQNTGQDDPLLLRNYSLYLEDYRNKNYEAALPPLRWILENAPAFRDDVNFERGVDLYIQLARMEEDPEEQRALLDTALVLLDTAVPTVRENGGEIDEFEWTIKKGTAIFENLDLLPELESEVAAQYQKAWELDPDRIDPYYLEYILADLLQNQGDKAATVEFLDEVEAQRGGEEAIAAMQSKWRGAIFTSPEERYTYLQSELEKDPANVEMIRELFDLAQDLDYRSDATEYGNQLLEVQPTASVYRKLGAMRLEDGDAEGALELMDKALSLSENPNDRRDTYYNMATAEQQLGRLSRARTSFRQALDIDPTFGRALLGIGDLYVTAIANCGSFEREDRAVYWLASDYFQRAKSVDASLAQAADQRVRQYRAYYPDAEAMFFMKWNQGDRYEINKGCYSWINESTTVKAP